MKLGFYAGRRVLLLVPVLLGVTFITFALTRIIPGDPISLLAGPYVSAARKAEIRHAFLLDRPFYLQYVHYVGNLLHGNLGTSIVSGQSVASELSRRFAATFELTTVALLFSVVVAVPLGILAALRRNSWLDGVSRVIGIAGISIPVFWLGVQLQVLFGIQLKLLPISGIGLDKHLILPAFALSVGTLALLIAWTTHSSSTPAGASG